ncbi:anti-anti-sigma factor [Microbulbifer donghaiensis]|uniref:Anti-anti-sigma factor n=1 Tax=Microbulbifer donghaiensis TaxID=494016 RepID=A0A1M5HFX3_9GAMM|nr:STAS domain-containing protein [Microbulbifer donghaiensis]SHG14856.1 anti-anti-sigma factor [Microbulbifer donghaiensis]
MNVSEYTAARVSSELSENGEALVIRVAGSFDFNVHRDFQRAYQNLSPSPRQYCVDLSETLYLDSAALGMLLLLRDHCQNDGTGAEPVRVELLNANEHVGNILTISNFDKIFTIR